MPHYFTLFHTRKVFEDNFSFDSKHLSSINMRIIKFSALLEEKKSAKDNLYDINSGSDLVIFYDMFPQRG